MRPSNLKQEGLMQQNDKHDETRDENTAAERDQLASNLAFLIVQAHRRDQRHVDASEHVAVDSDS